MRTAPETIAATHYLTSHEVGDLLQVNPSSVNKWVKEGRIVAYRTPGGHRRILASNLVAFLDEYKMPVPEKLAHIEATKPTAKPTKPAKKK